MSRKQKLKNAVILGVMLSSITAGSVWAADHIYADKNNGQNVNESYTGDVDIENNSEVINVGSILLFPENSYVSGLGASGWKELFSNKDASLTVTGADNLTITVGNMNAGEAGVAGIIAGHETVGTKPKGTVTVNVNEALVINATTYNKKEGYGILAKENGTVNVTAGSVEINANKGNETTNGNVYGVKTSGDLNDTLNSLLPDGLPKIDTNDGNGQINITATGDVSITATNSSTDDKGLKFGVVSGNSTAVDGNVNITSQEGNITLTAVADMGRAVAIGGGDGKIEATKGDVTAVAKSNINLTSFLNTEDVFKDSIDIPGITEALDGLFGANVAIGDKEIIAGGNVSAEATSIIGHVKGIDNDKNITAGGDVISKAGTVLGNTTGITGSGTITSKNGNVISMAGTVLGNATGIDNSKLIKANNGDVAGIAGSLIGGATGITGGGEINANNVTGIAVTGTDFSSVSGLVDLKGILGQLGLPESVVGGLEPIIDKILSATESQAIGIENTNSISANANVNGIAGSITGTATGIVNSGEFTSITADKDVNGIAGSLLGTATGIVNDDGSAITATNGNVTGVAATGLGSGDILDLAGLQDLLNKIDNPDIKNLIEGILKNVGTDSTAIGIDNTGFITAENGTVLGMAGSIGGDAIGIKNEGTITAETVFGQAASLNSDAIGIESGSITADGNVVGLAAAKVLAMGVNAGNITKADNVIGQAVSTDGDAYGIVTTKGTTWGSITAAGNVVGLAEAKELAMGVNAGNINAKDVFGQALSIDGAAYGINATDNITADGSVVGMAAAKGEADGIIAQEINAKDVFGQGLSTDGYATGICTNGDITANGNVIGMAEAEGKAQGIYAGNITKAENVLGQAVSVEGEAYGINAHKNITAAGSVVGMAEAKESATGIHAYDNIKAENVFGQAVSVENTANGISATNVEAAGNVVGMAAGKYFAAGIGAYKDIKAENVFGQAVSAEYIAYGISAYGNIEASGNVVGMAAAKGNAEGIYAGNIIKADNVIGQAVSTEGRAYGIDTVYGETWGDITVTGNVVGMAEAKERAMGINADYIEAANVFGQALSVESDAYGINADVTAENGSVIGMAEAKYMATGISADVITAQEVFGQAASVDGEANGIYATTITATGSVVGMAASVNDAAYGIDTTDLVNELKGDITANGNVVGMAEAKDMAKGINAGNITKADNVIGQAVSTEGKAYGIDTVYGETWGDIEAAGNVIGMAEAKDLAEGVKAGIINAQNVIGQAASANDEAIAVLADKITADGNVIGMADAKGNTFGILANEVTADNVIGQAASVDGAAYGINVVNKITADGSVIGTGNSFMDDAFGIYGTSVEAYDVIGQASSHDGNATAIDAQGADESIKAAGIVTGLAGSVKGEATGIIARNIEANDVFAQAGSVDGAATAINSTNAIKATEGNVIGMAGSVYNAATAITGGAVTAGSEIIGMATSFSGNAIGVQGGTITAGGNVTGMAVTGEEIAALLQDFENLNVKDSELTEDEILKGSGIATGIESNGDITAENGSVIGVGISIAGRAVGIKGNGNITAGDSVIATANSIKGNAAAIVGAGEKITAGDSVIAQAGSVDGDVVGIYGDRVITAGNSNIVTAGSVNGDAVGIYGGSQLTAGNSNIVVAASKAGDSYGLYVDDIEHSNELKADVDNVIYGGNAGVKVFNGGTVTLDAGNINVIVAEKNREDVTKEDEHYNAVSVGAGSNFTANGAMNILRAGEVDAEGFGSETAVSVVGDKDKLANFELNGSGGNIVQGAVYTQNGNVDITSAAGSNVIYSAAHGYTTGGDGSQHLVSALYAAENARITLSAENGVNVIKSSVDFVHDNDREITVWAENGGNVNIKGAVDIESSNNANYYENGNGNNGNALGIAISAGGRNMDRDIPAELGVVNIEYGSDVQQTSRIIGDIVAGYNGEVNISQKLAVALDDEAAPSGSKLYIEGNALAANGGKLNLDLGNGGVWYGRADNYGDAGVDKDGNHTNFYNPAFSNKIVEGGTVNININDGMWVLTGQSWVSELNAKDSIIDMAGQYISEENKNKYDMNDAHALVVDQFTGEGSTFIMDLDSVDVGTSDMLYIKDNEGTFNVQLADALDVDALYARGELRFATIHGELPDIDTVTYAGSLFSNVTYDVKSEEFTKDDEDNTIYNEGEDTNTKVKAVADEPAKDTGSFANGKPGEDFINNSFANGDKNLIITGVTGIETGKIGQTIVDMSKANYTNAIYMDRLNKRMGETRFIDGDEGMWVRLRHDRIGKEDSFRSMNTMYEMGYDVKQVKDNGEHRVGVAIDYMDGSTSYSKLGGDGEISRKGIWMYDTWVGEKGHYRDFVAKWGHLSNDFDVYAVNGDNVTGDYSNNVYSISAEFGKKNDIGNNWYFEPQAQLQYAHVTGAEYMTNTGTAVNVDDINSLIARAGFRLGKDLGERSTVYFKADLMHEFLGEQDVFAMDKSTGTSGVHERYDHGGTWCDLGFGFVTAMSKTSYAYLDVETSLGNDYDETYQINAGLQWTF